MISGWLPAAIKASNAPPSGSSSTVTFLPGLAWLYLSASLRMVSIIAPRTTAIRVPPAVLGGRVAVTVAAAVAAPLWVAVGATVSVADPPATAPAGVSVAPVAGTFAAVGIATAPGGVLDGAAAPPAGLVGVIEVEPDAQADRIAKESTMLNRIEIAFNSLVLELYILLSFEYQANTTTR